MLIRIPADESKNEEPTEHFLTSAAVKLMRLYIDRYRPLIVDIPGAWLFPSPEGGHKTENTFGTQLTDWVRGALGIYFHPHLVRKIMTKLYLDDVPEGIEVMRRQLGHKSDVMVRRVYMQRRNRAAQLKFNKVIEGRRLSSFGAMKRSNRKRRRG